MTTAFYFGNVNFIALDFIVLRGTRTAMKLVQAEMFALVSFKLGATKK